GWDFAHTANDPMASGGHGTHVTGMIAARGNNGVGIAGVNWKARILPMDVFQSGSITTSAGIAAIDYAVAQGAKVINASWGDYVGDPGLVDAVRFAGDHGIVMVAAAGNQSNNNDLNPYLPASYNLPNLISVASLDAGGNLSSFSNFGRTTVALAAPGEGIVSTWPGNDYATLSGTSMASPQVAGVVSLLAGQYPNASPSCLFNQLL